MFRVFFAIIAIAAGTAATSIPTSRVSDAAFTDDHARRGGSVLVPPSVKQFVDFRQHVTV